MYNPLQQHPEIHQFFSSKLFLFNKNQRAINQYDIVMPSIKEFSEQNLYLRIMEILAGLDTFPTAKRNQNGLNIGLKYENNDKIQSNLNKKQSNASQITDGRIVNPFCLSSPEGLSKLQRIMSAVLKHCDQLNRTKHSHKVFYLIIKYLYFRANNKSKNRQEYLSKDQLIQWLSNASRLLADQMQNPPVQIVEPAHPQKYGFGNLSNIKKVSDKLKKQLAAESANLKNNPVLDGLNQDSVYLQKNNPYSYLINYAQNCSLQQLVAQLENMVGFVSRQFYRQVNEVNGKHFQDEADIIHEMVAILTQRITTVIQIIIKRVYIQDEVMANSKINEINQSINRLLATKILKSKQSKQNAKKMSLRPGALQKIPEQPLSIFSSDYEEYNSEIYKNNKNLVQIYQNLTTVLKYIIGIMLGTESVIATYATNNVYLYLKLKLLYGDMQVGAKYKDAAIQYIHRMHYISIPYQHLQDRTQLKLLPTHNLLLELLSLTREQPGNQSTNLTSMQSDFQNEQYLNYHRILQQIMQEFSQNEFYGHLLSTIFFNLKFINRQFYLLDDQYQNNCIQHLLLSCVNCVNQSTTTQQYNSQQVNNLQYNQEYNNMNSPQLGIQNQDNQYQIGENNREGSRVGSMEGYDHQNNDNQEGFMYSNQQEMQERSHQFNYNNQYNNGTEIKQTQSDHPQNNAKSKQIGRLGQDGIIEQNKYSTSELTRIKLLLCGLSYYKNTLYKSNRYLQLYLKHKLQSKGQQVIPSNINLPVMYMSLPLHCLLDCLLAQNLFYGQVTNQFQLNRIRILASYASKLSISEYFGRYLRMLISAHFDDLNMVDSGQVPTKHIDQWILQLLVIQLEYSHNSIHQDNNLIAQPQSLQWMINKQQNIQYQLIYPDNLYLSKVNVNFSHGFENTFTYTLLQSNYLTNCTLNQAFDYKLLDKLRQLAKGNEHIAGMQQLLNYFYIYMKLQGISPRSTPPKQQSPNQLTHRLKSLYSLIHPQPTSTSTPTPTPIQGCGQIIRVVWQCFTKYEQLKQQHMQLQSLKFNCKEDSNLNLNWEKMSQMLLLLVEELRNYLEYVRACGYWSYLFQTVAQLIY